MSKKTQKKKRTQNAKSTQIKQTQDAHAVKSTAINQNPGKLLKTVDVERSSGINHSYVISDLKRIAFIAIPLFLLLFILQFFLK